MPLQPCGAWIRDQATTTHTLSPHRFSLWFCICRYWNKSLAKRMLATEAVLATDLQKVHSSRVESHSGHGTAESWVEREGGREGGGERARAREREKLLTDNNQIFCWSGALILLGSNPDLAAWECTLTPRPCDGAGWAESRYCAVCVCWDVFKCWDCLLSVPHTKRERDGIILKVGT